MNPINQTDQLPPQVLTYFLVAAVAEINFLYAPRKVVGVAGQDAWLAVVLAFVGFGLAVALMFDLVRRFPGETLVEISQRLLGPAGTLLATAYISFWVIRAGVLIKLQTFIYTLTLLPETPQTVLALYLLLVSTYLTRHGFEPLARLTVLFFPAFFLPLSLVTLFSLQEADIARLQPLWIVPADVLARGAAYAFAPGWGFEAILMLGPFLTKFGGGLRASLFGVFWIGAAATGITSLLIARFGSFSVSQMVWPTLTLVELIDVPGFIGLRLDSIFIVIWTLMTFLSIAIAQFLAVTALRRVMGASLARHSLWPDVVVVFLIVAILLPPYQLPVILNTLERTLPILTPLALVGLPGLLWLRAWWVQVRGRTR